MEWINNFKCSGYNTSYEGENDLNVRNVNYVEVLGMISNLHKLSLISRHTRTWIYRTITRLILESHGQKEMMKETYQQKCISDSIKNEEIVAELQISQIIEFREYRRIWKNRLRGWVLTGFQNRY